MSDKILVHFFSFFNTVKKCVNNSVKTQKLKHIIVLTTVMQNVKICYKKFQFCSKMEIAVQN